MFQFGSPAELRPVVTVTVPPVLLTNDAPFSTDRESRVAFPLAIESGSNQTPVSGTMIPARLAASGSDTSRS